MHNNNLIGYVPYSLAQLLSGLIDGESVERIDSKIRTLDLFTKKR